MAWPKGTIGSYLSMKLDSVGHPVNAAPGPIGWILLSIE